MGKRPEACRGLHDRELAATVFHRFPFVIGRICRADFTDRRPARRRQKPMRYLDQTTVDDEANLNTFGAYRLMTAEIVFQDTETKTELGDAAMTWRDYDITPGFPRLRAFVDRWRDDPEIKVQSVTVTEIDEARMPACRISPSTAAVH
jgi:uncharacterized protein Usg